MPKGRVVERDVTCRGCGTVFVSARSGKAAFYCHRPVCDAERARTGHRVPNTVGMGAREAARARTGGWTSARIMRMQAAVAREQARFERQWRVQADVFVRQVQNELARQGREAAARQASQRRVLERIEARERREQERLDRQIIRDRLRAETVARRKREAAETRAKRMRERLCRRSPSFRRLSVRPGSPRPGCMTPPRCRRPHRRLSG